MAAERLALDCSKTFVRVVTLGLAILGGTMIGAASIVGAVDAIDYSHAESTHTNEIRADKRIAIGVGALAIVGGALGATGIKLANSVVEEQMPAERREDEVAGALPTPGQS